MITKFNLQTEYQKAMKLRRKTPSFLTSDYTIQQFENELKEQADAIYLAYEAVMGSVIQNDTLEFALHPELTISSHCSNYKTTDKLHFYTSKSYEHIFKRHTPYCLLPSPRVYLASGSYPFLNRSLLELATGSDAFFFFGGVYGDTRDPYFLHQVNKYRTLEENLAFYHQFSLEEYPLIQEVDYPKQKKMILICYEQEYSLPKQQDLYIS